MHLYTQEKDARQAKVQRSREPIQIAGPGEPLVACFARDMERSVDYVHLKVTGCFTEFESMAGNVHPLQSSIAFCEILCNMDNRDSCTEFLQFFFYIYRGQDNISFICDH